MYFFNLVRHHIIFKFNTKQPISSLVFGWSVAKKGLKVWVKCDYSEFPKPFTLKCMCTLQTWTPPWGHEEVPSPSAGEFCRILSLLFAISKAVIGRRMHVLPNNTSIGVRGHKNRHHSDICMCCLMISNFMPRASSMIIGFTIQATSLIIMNFIHSPMCIVEAPILSIRTPSTISRVPESTCRNQVE
jgi:hypothetical protein